MNPCSRPSRVQGFTLLELCVVMMVMALMMGLAVYSFRGLDGESAIRYPASELESMAKEAVRRASLYETPQVIVFEKTGFLMQYRQEADANSNADQSAKWQRRVTVPSEMKILIRRWGTKKWIPATGERWVISAGGFCEPLEVRLELGESFIQMEFDPLSGGVREESMRVASL